MMSLTTTFTSIRASLSCGDDDMTPGNIIGMSALKELDVIAVTDHNSCKNCPAVMELAKALWYYRHSGHGADNRGGSPCAMSLSWPGTGNGLLTAMFPNIFSTSPMTRKIFGRQLVCDSNDEIIDSIQSF